MAYLSPSKLSSRDIDHRKLMNQTHLKDEKKKIIPSQPPYSQQFLHRLQRVKQLRLEREKLVESDVLWNRSCKSRLEVPYSVCDDYYTKLRNLQLYPRRALSAHTRWDSPSRSNVHKFLHEKHTQASQASRVTVNSEKTKKQVPWVPDGRGDIGSHQTFRSGSKHKHAIPLELNREKDQKNQKNQKPTYTFASHALKLSSQPPSPDTRGSFLRKNSKHKILTSSKKVEELYGISRLSNVVKESPRSSKAAVNSSSLVLLRGKLFQQLPNSIKTSNLVPMSSSGILMMRSSMSIDDILLEVERQWKFSERGVNIIDLLLKQNEELMYQLSKSNDEGDFLLELNRQQTVEVIVIDIFASSNGLNTSVDSESTTVSDSLEAETARDPDAIPIIRSHSSEEVQEELSKIKNLYANGYLQYEHENTSNKSQK